jgi:hypothetical protein
MILFRMVENHYSDRVMRQFGIFQQVHSPAPIDYQQVLTYRKNKHTSGCGEWQNIDWAQYYWWAQDEPELPITESRPYDYAQHYTYMGWYYKRGMNTIWYGMDTDEHLSQPSPHPEEHVDELSYVPHLHPVLTIIGSNLIYQLKLVSTNNRFYFFFNSSDCPSD